MFEKYIEYNKILPKLHFKINILLISLFGRNKECLQ